MRLSPRAAAGLLLLALTALAAPQAAEAAEPPAAAPAAGPAPTAPAAGEERPPILGVQLAFGAPDGLVLGAAYRPWTFLRLNGGVAWNYLGFGVQGGATLLPIHFAITPTLTGEVGYYFPADYASRIERWTGTLSPEVRPLLEHIGYTYLSTQLGVEFGGADSFVFFLRFGVAWIFTSANGPVTSTSGSGSTTYVIQGVEARVAVPTVNLGFVVYVW
jgi:hypothetical protein